MQSAIHSTKDATFVLMNTDQSHSNLYTPELIDFARTGVELAALLEQGGQRREVIRRLIELLPRLYAQMLRLPEYFYSSDEDYIEEYITQEGYDRVRTRLEHILGEYDSYLTTFSPEMQYSDTPLASTISEALADVYQHIGNLLGILRAENTIALPAAIGRCYLYWREHWGVQLLSALSALHQVYTMSLPEQDEEDMEVDEADTDLSMQEYE